MRLFKRPVSVCKQWLCCMLYELREEWVDIEGVKVMRYAWFNDADRRVSRWYRDEQQARVAFGVFDEHSDNPHSQMDLPL